MSVTFALFAIGGMGGGDAKLIAASSLWMGFNLNLLVYLVISTIIGGALTLLILSYRNSPLADLTGRNMFLRHFADPQGRHSLWPGARARRAASPIRIRRSLQWAIGRLSDTLN